jgi:hypothetical protein
MTRLFVAFLAIVVLAMPARAQAEVLAVGILEGTYSQRVSSSAWQAVFTSAAGTTLAFNSTQNNERIVITYNATCIAAGFTAYIRAKIDGVIGKPGATKDVSFCLTSVSGGAYPAIRTFTAVVPTIGTHTVSIEVKGSGGGAAMVIGDSTLIVQH